MSAHSLSRKVGHWSNRQDLVGVLNNILRTISIACIESSKLSRITAMMNMVRIVHWNIPVTNFNDFTLKIEVKRSAKDLLALRKRNTVPVELFRAWCRTGHCFLES